MESAYSVSLPDYYTDWTKFIQEVVNLDWSIFFVPERCLAHRFRGRLLITAFAPFTPLVIMIVVLSMYRLTVNFRKSATKGANTFRRLVHGTSSILLSVTPMALLITFVFGVFVADVSIVAAHPLSYTARSAVGKRKNIQSVGL